MLSSKRWRSQKPFFLFSCKKTEDHCDKECSLSRRKSQNEAWRFGFLFSVLLLLVPELNDRDGHAFSKTTSQVDRTPDTQSSESWEPAVKTIRVRLRQSLKPSAEIVLID
jgi:hypothetical protein